MSKDLSKLSTETLKEDLIKVKKWRDESGDKAAKMVWSDIISFIEGELKKREVVLEAADV